MKLWINKIQNLLHWLDFTEKSQSHFVHFLNLFLCFTFLGLLTDEFRYFFQANTSELFRSLACSLLLISGTGLFTLFRNRFSRVIGWVGFGILISLAVFYFTHYEIFDVPPSPNVYISIFETDKSESIEFFKTYISLTILMKLILIAVIAGGLAWILAKKVFRSLPLAKIYVLAVFFSICAVHKDDFKTSSPLRLFDNYLTYQEQRTAFLESLSHFNKDLHVKTIVPKTKENKIVVLVVGESTTRNRMSLYGYTRNTNPELSKFKQDLYLFQNIVSPHSHTVSSLNKSLTLLNYDNESALKENSHVIQLAHDAGYKTFWISNQASLGDSETMLSAIANNADQAYWLNDSSDFYGNKHYDMAVVPYLKSILQKNEGSVFITIHLMGTHASYEDRYPPEHKFFKDRISPHFALTDQQWKVYNEYDDAIRYNDSVIAELIQTLTKQSNPASLIYFSDHGEEVYESRPFAAHTEAMPSNHMFEIPFIIWSKDSELTRTLSNLPPQRFQQLWSIEDLIHALHDIFQVTSDIYEGNRSLLGPNFKEIPRLVGGKKYRPNNPDQQFSCPTKNDFFPKDKVWVHRVDSLERLRALKDQYSGFEVDVVWDNKTSFFDIYHEPVPSIGLNLETYFKEPQLDKKYFWLDYKNLDASNLQSSLAELVKLDRIYKIKERILVESSSPEFLGPFKKAGFRTSYYLPAEIDGFDILNPNWGLLTQYSSYVTPRLSDSLSGVSQNYRSLEVLDGIYPLCDKFVWLWKDDLAKLPDILQRRDVKVVLVPVESAGYR